MQSEAPSTGRSALPPRAGVALLTLQLRASLQEAKEAEAAAATDALAAREQLRERLEQLIEERRVQLDAALADAHAEAATAIEAAQRAASVMAAQASSTVNGASPAIENAAARRTTAPAPDAVSDIPAGDVATSVVESVAPKTLRVADERAPIDTRSGSVGQSAQPLPAFDEEPPTANLPIRQSARADRVEPAQTATPHVAANIVIDAEAFARVFATVLASMLDERFSALGGMPSRQVLAPPPPPKRSFRANVLHPDVILMGLTMIVVLFVLAAWLA